MAITKSEMAGDLPDIAKRLLMRLRARQGKAYRLAWKGSKIPRGAKLNGDRITWTQHGCVYTGQLTGEIVGYYTRTKEWDGPDKDEHEMIIATNGEVTAGLNQSVELVRDFPITASEENQ